MTTYTSFPVTRRKTEAAKVLLANWRGYSVRKHLLRPRDIDFSKITLLLSESEYETAQLICRKVIWMKQMGLSSLLITEGIGYLSKLPVRKEQVKIRKLIKINHPLLIEIDKRKETVFLHVINSDLYLGRGEYKHIFASRSLALIKHQCYFQKSAVAYLPENRRDQRSVRCGVKIERFVYQNYYSKNLFNFPFYGAFRLKGREVHLTMQKRFSCDLEEYLEQEGPSLSCLEISAIFFELFAHLEMIHVNGFIHNDIKAKNIFCDLDKKIGSFLYVGDWDLAEHRSYYVEEYQEYVYWNLARRKGYITKTTDIYGAMIAICEYVLGDSFKEYFSNPHDLLNEEKQIAFIENVLRLEVQRLFGDDVAIQPTHVYEAYEKELLSLFPEKNISKELQSIHLIFHTYALLIQLLEKDFALFNWLESNPSHQELLKSEDLSELEKIEREIERRYLSARTIKEYFRRFLTPH